MSGSNADREPEPGRSTQPAALFDLDSSLIGCESVRLFGLHMLGLPPAFAWRLCGAAVSDALPTNLWWALALWALGRVDAVAREAALHGFCEARGPAYPRGALACIDWHRRQGHLLILLSAGPEALASRAAAELDFDAAVGSRIQLGGERAQLDGAECRGAERLARLQQLEIFDAIDWPASFAYSGRIDDLALLGLVGQPIAARPGRRLRRHAIARGWEIVDWALPGER
ncbi:MAG: haloacid dehalogenase-like hydrolase [Deltaproteobacteria bacterium]|nr:haloacid dehalogenase-like hydrolase [Deltaproteobacteria bacterium]